MKRLLKLTILSLSICGALSGCIVYDDGYYGHPHYYWHDHDRW